MTFDQVAVITVDDAQQRFNFSQHDGRKATFQLRRNSDEFTRQIFQFACADGKVRFHLADLRVYFLPIRLPILKIDK